MIKIERLAVVALAFLALGCTRQVGNQAKVKEGEWVYAVTPSGSFEIGDPVAYLTQEGDTTISYGRFSYAGTDSFALMGVVIDEEDDWIAINNRGEKKYDLFPFEGSVYRDGEGMYRIVGEDGKVGYADQEGNIVVEPQYKVALCFMDGYANVTYGNASSEYGVDPSKDEVWRLIDTSGRAVLEYQPMAFEEDVPMELRIAVLDERGEGTKLELLHSYKSFDRYPPMYPFEPQVKLEDINMDGERDILVFLGAYGKQAMVYWDAYLYNPETEQYDYNDGFKRIGNPIVIPEYESVFSYGLSSAASYEYNQYIFKDGVFVKVGRLTASYNNSSDAPLYVEEELQDGRVVSTKRGIEAEDLDTIWKPVIERWRL